MSKANKKRKYVRIKTQLEKVLKVGLYYQKGYAYIIDAAGDISRFRIREVKK